MHEIRSGETVEDFKNNAKNGGNGVEPKIVQGGIVNGAVGNGAASVVTSSSAFTLSATPSSGLAASTDHAAYMLIGLTGALAAAL
jgi:hypothetical protein